MSTSDPIAPDRLEALLRGESGDDGRERRIGALMDELTVGEIAPPAELRERVRSLSAAPAVTPAAPRRLPRLPSLRGQRRRLAPVLGLAAIVAVIAGVAVDADGDVPPRTPSLEAAQAVQELRPGVNRAGRSRGAARARSRRTPSRTPEARRPPSAPLPDGQRAQDYAASLRLAVGSVARALALDAERARHRALARRRRRDRRLRHAERRQRQRADRPARACRRARRRRSALLRARHDHGAAGADPRSAGRARSGDATAPARCVTASSCSRRSCSPRRSRPRSARRSRARLADSQTALESVLRGVHATQQRAAFARFSLELVTGRGTAVAPPAQPGAVRAHGGRRARRDLGGRARRALRRHRRRPVRAARRRSLVALAALQAPRCAAVARELRDALARRVAPGSEGRAGGDAEHPGEREPPDDGRDVLEPQARRAAGAARAARLEPGRDGCQRDGAGQRRAASRAARPDAQEERQAEDDRERTAAGASARLPMCASCFARGSPVSPVRGRVGRGSAVAQVRGVDDLEVRAGDLAERVQDVVVEVLVAGARDVPGASRCRPGSSRRS